MALNEERAFLILLYCPCLPLAPVCEDNQLLCDNRCLESYQLCDGHQDCSDGTDEQGCPATKAPVGKEY